MGFYTLRDISSTFSGDLVLDSRGDLKLADSVESQRNSVNFWLRTDYADYPAATEVGANLGEFIGQLITRELLQDIENQVYTSLVENLVAPEDLEVHVVPFTRDEALVAVRVGGTYLDDEGNEIKTTKEIFNYIFPYIEGQIYPV